MIYMLKYLRKQGAGCPSFQFKLLGVDVDKEEVISD